MWGASCREAGPEQRTGWAQQGPMELDKGQGVRSTGSQTRARSDEAKERDEEQTKNRRDEGSADRQMNERKVVIEQLSGAGRKRKRNHTGEEKV